MPEEPQLSERDRLEEQIASLIEAIDAVSSAVEGSPILDWLSEIGSVIEECEEILRIDDEIIPERLDKDDFDSLGIEAECLSDVLNEGRQILAEAMDDEEETDSIFAESRKMLSLQVKEVQKQAWLLYQLLIRAA